MSLSVPIPSFRSSHCPFMRISNFKPAHVRWCYPTLQHTSPTPAIYAKIVRPWMEYTLLYIYKRRKIAAGGYHLINPRGRLCCITAAWSSNLLDLGIQTGNVSKTSFRDWSYKWPEVSIHRCYCSCPPSRGQVSGANLNNYFKLTNIFKEKLHLKAKKIDER